MEYRKKSKKQNNSPLLYSISHDGRKVDEKDLISNFDSNNDGVLDVAELHVLSEQLTNQLQYNNTLIAQVQSLEQENFSLQQELHSQRELIRNVSKNYGESSNEVADLKSKLKTTQGIVENLSRQLRDCRLENDLLKRDAENAMETNVVSRTELENTKKELQSTKKQLADSDKAKNRVMEESRLHKSEADFKWSSLQTKNDALAKEVNFLKANILATEQEKKDLLTSSKEVTQAFNELKKQFDTEQFARQVSEKKINSISSNYDNIQKELVEKEVQLKDLHEKVDALTSKVRQQSVDRSDSEGRIRELEDALMDHQLSHKAFSEEKALMAKNEAKVKAEHANEMKKQRLELEKKLQALSEKYTESSRALNELQRQSEESLTSAQQKLIETYKAKALAEESCKAMQTCLDEAALHCEGLKADHQLQLGECALQQNRAEVGY
jgi:chromosome segregation ATPase